MGKQLQLYRKLFDTIKKGDVHRLYFLYGPEEYLKKEFIREVLNTALPDDNRAFNLDILYGDEFDARLLDDRLTSFPLFNERRVVILKNFKALSTAQKDTVVAAAEKSTDAVVFIVESPEEKLDTVRLKNLKKVADAAGMSFNFAFLDEQETIERVTGRFRREGYEVKQDALDVLVESVGTRLIDLGNEVEKILLAAGDAKVVDRELVTSVVGKYRTENLFSLLDTLAKRSPATILQKLNALIDGGEEPVFILAMLLRRVLLLLEARLILDSNGRAINSGRALADHMAGPISPFFAEVLKRQAATYEVAQLERMLVNLRWADIKLKSTPLDARTVIEEALMASHVGKTLASTQVST